MTLRPSTTENHTDGPSLPGDDMPDQSRFLAKLLDEMFDGVYFVDLDRKIT
jgi:hypothetical protein